MLQGIVALMVGRKGVAPPVGITQIQKKSYGSTAGSTTHAITLDSTPVNGDMLILGIVADDLFSSISGSGWSQAVQSLDNSSTYFYWKIAGASEPTTITVTIATATSCALGCMEYSGLTTVDKTANATGQNGSNAPISTGTTVTTTAANELVVGIAGMWGFTGTNGQNVTSWNNSFVSQCAGNSGTDLTHPFIGLDMAVKVVSATGAYVGAATTNLSLSSNDTGAIATFK